MDPYVKKYLPEKVTDIIGQDEAVKNLFNFIELFRKKKKKAAFLYGPTGTGKTSSVYVLAKSLNFEILEVNASDIRNKDQIEQRLGASIKQRSLFSNGKIILIDEVDGLSGKSDRGGIQTMANIVDETNFPIFFTATDPWDNKLSGIRKKSEMISFNPLGYSDILIILQNICKKEKIIYEEDSLKSLARRAGGDARAAINDLQSLTTKTNELDKKSLDELADREKEESMINAIMKIFKTTDLNIAASSFDYVKEDVDGQMLWLDENLPNEYKKPEDLARAYENMSKADIFKSRIRRWQHWRFLVYINSFLTAGITSSKDEKYKTFVEYKPTSRILKIWWANQKSMKKKAIATKIAAKTHTSAKNILSDFDYFKMIFKKNKQMANSLIGYLDLDKEEVDWLKK